LQVFNGAGNNAAKNPNYKHYCLAHMKSLKYLDYCMVDEESIAVAREKYMDAIITLEAESKLDKQKKAEARKRDELSAIYEVFKSNSESAYPWHRHAV
jgi:hypothetical protein